MKFKLIYNKMRHYSQQIWLWLIPLSITFITCTQQEETVPPVACFYIENPSLTIGETISINNCSENAENYSWNFGDGFLSPDVTPTHSYEMAGNYTIELIAVNKELTDKYTYSVTVTEEPVGEFSITTKTITNITPNQAQSGGTIINATGKSLVNKGICYATSSMPTIDNYTTNEGSGNDEFTSTLSNLEPETQYYVRAFAILSNDTQVYGNQQIFSTPNEIAEGPGKATIYKTTNTPKIDGILDELWEGITAQEINMPFNGTDVVSYNGTASWKAIWDDNNIYVLVQVPDDDYYPSAETGGDPWTADLVELYFDINEEKVDGLGPEEGIETGHYQFAPTIDNLEYTDCQYAYEATINIGDDSKSYFIEYAIPFSFLVDNNKEILNPYQRTQVGFDITLIDLDEVGKGATTESFQRVTWTNDSAGDKEESWNNMDWSGDLIFSANESSSLVANFTADKTSVAPEESIQFTNLSSGNPTSWYWEFGDGNNSTEKDPKHSYLSEGNFTIKLTASNGSESNTATKTNYIAVTSSTSLPTVSTLDIYNIYETNVKSGGNITDDGGQTITERGICWNTAGEPTTSDFKSSDGNNVGEYTSILNMLEPGTTYFARAYASSSAGTAYGQQISFSTIPSETKIVEVNKTTTQPIVDGVIDAVWANEKANPIKRNVRDEIVSLGVGATFKTLWDDNYIYVLVEVPDDNFYPYDEAGVLEYMADKVAMYFDVNEVLADGLGAQATGSGHNIIAPYYNLTSLEGVNFIYNVTNDASYIAEYAIAISSLYDNTNAVFNPNMRSTIGFDIDISDLDETGLGANETRGRAIWANNAAVDENWTNMDGAGKMMFLGAEPVTALSSFSEDFSLLNLNDNPNLLEGWSSYNEIGNLTWLAKDFEGDKYLARHNYKTGLSELKTWVITPLLDFSSGNRGLVFESAAAFWTHSSTQPLEVFISTDYNGSDMSSATWSKLDCKIANETTGFYTDYGSGKIDLSSYSGNGYIAFVYHGNLTETTTMRLDDIVFAEFSTLVSLADLSTDDVTNITITSATCGGSFIDEGGESASEYGICWSTEAVPKISHFTAYASGFPLFTAEMYDLMGNTTYYVRSYAINSAGIAYGPINSFATKPETDTLSDIDGNYYNTVKIGDQWWMAENLKVTHYPDGSEIPLVTDDETWIALGDNDVDDAYCYKDYDASSIYGPLYTWAAAMGGNGATSSNTNPSNIQGACPNGWHLPSESEWIQLQTFITNDGFSSIEGKALKSNEGWSTGGNGTDNYGFTGLPGGDHGGIDGIFYNATFYGIWWSSTEYNSEQAKFIMLNHDKDNIEFNYYVKSNGYSVRCLKD